MTKYYVISQEDVERILQMKNGCFHQEDCTVVTRGNQALLSKAKLVDLDEAIIDFLCTKVKGGGSVVVFNESRDKECYFINKDNKEVKFSDFIGGRK